MAASDVSVRMRGLHMTSTRSRAARVPSPCSSCGSGVHGRASVIGARKRFRLRAGQFLGLCAVGLGLSWAQSSVGGVPPERPALGEPCSTIAPKSDGTAEDIQGPGLPFPITLPCAERVSTNGKFGTVAGGAGIEPIRAGTDQQLKNLQHGFDFYSWLTFIALNSPFDGSDIMKGAASTKTKWEDVRYFRQLSDVMLPEGKKPDSWGTPSVVPAKCTGRAPRGTMILHLEEEAFNQPFKTGPLIDQNGNYALFDILMNKSMYDTIVDNGLYSRAGQTANNQPVKFRSGFLPGKKEDNRTDDPMSPGDPGAFMLKVAWKVIDRVKDRDIANTFHTVEALIYTPASADGKVREDCSGPTTLGLIGFHAVHKTADRKQWIWTTFEHKDNVPQRSELNAQLNNRSMKILKDRYLFFDPTRLDKPINQTPLRPWHPSVQPFPGGFTSQIVREISIDKDAEELNNEFQKKLMGTVWQNYVLVSTQWPSAFNCARLDTDEDQDAEGRTKTPDPSCAPAPTYLANTTLETFSQGTTPLSSSSCMACHLNATTQQNPAMQSDFTFMLEKAKGPPTAPVP